MIKAKAGNSLLLGLSRTNVERLEHGFPIQVKGEQLQIPYDIFIFFGETEAIMMKHFKDCIPDGSIELGKQKEGE